MKPLYSINCSNLGFYNLPKNIPENTTIFSAMHNHVSEKGSKQMEIFWFFIISIPQISDIKSLGNSYRSVHDVYLDYNLVTSISSLESGGWLENFRLFSLKGNLLTKVLFIYVICCNDQII